MGREGPACRPCNRGSDWRAQTAKIGASYRPSEKAREGHGRKERPSEKAREGHGGGEMCDGVRRSWKEGDGGRSMVGDGGRWWEMVGGLTCQ